MHRLIKPPLYRKLTQHCKAIIFQFKKKGVTQIFSFSIHIKKFVYSTLQSIKCVIYSSKKTMYIP